MKYEFDQSASGKYTTRTKTYGKINYLFLFTFYVNNKPNIVPEMSPFSPVLPFETESRF